MKVNEGMVWTTLLKGMLLIAFGFIALLWPGLTLVTLVFIFALYIVLVGILNLVGGIGEMGTTQNWFFSFIVGLVEIAAGIYALVHPGLSLTTLILLVGVVFLVRGIMEVVGGMFKESMSSKKKTLMLTAGVLSAVAGVIILLYPTSGGIAFSWVLGAYAFISGGLMVALALELRSMSGMIA